MAVSRNGERVYVSSHGVQAGPSTPTPADTMHGGMHAGEGAARGGGTIAVIDADTRTVEKVIRVGRYAVAIDLGGAR